MLTIRTFTFNGFEENTYVAYDETRQAVIIDPGCYAKEEQDELSSFIETEQLDVKFVLNTHGHIDHVLGNYFVKRKFNVPLYIHAGDLAVLKSVKSYASNYGLAGYQEVLPDDFLEEGVPVKFGTSTLEVLFLPGHSPGHVGFYVPDQQVLVAGDVLFYRSIGRTDLPGGNTETLLNSIHQKLFQLPDEVVVYPGHGPTTKIGEERVHNPFCAQPVR